MTSFLVLNIPSAVVSLAESSRKWLLCTITDQAKLLGISSRRSGSNALVVVQVTSSPLKSRQASPPKRSISHTASAHDPEVWQAPPAVVRAARPSLDGSRLPVSGERLPFLGTKHRLDCKYTRLISKIAAS